MFQITSASTTIVCMVSDLGIFLYYVLKLRFTGFQLQSFKNVLMACMILVIFSFVFKLYYKCHFL